MPEPYMANEALEHAERAHEALEREQRTILRFVPVLAAVLAVCAGLSSLYASRLAENALGLKNEAVLAQGHASDAWAQYQAESIKAHLFEISFASGATGGSSGAHLRSQAAHYRRLQAPIRKEAQRAERERDDALRGSVRVEDRKVIFDVALALFEVAIVLASIAAMIKRHWMFVFAGFGGVLGLAFTIYGLFR